MKQEAEIERRTKFYNAKEVARLLSKDGVPKSRRAMLSLISSGITSTTGGQTSQDLIDCLSYVSFAVHPQQINVRDKANGKIIASIPR